MEFCTLLLRVPCLVRATGLEPAQPCDHKNLNLTRLPIPPRPHIKMRCSFLHGAALRGGRIVNPQRYQYTKFVSACQVFLQNFLHDSEKLPFKTDPCRDCTFFITGFPCGSVHFRRRRLNSGNPLTKRGAHDRITVIIMPRHRFITAIRSLSGC